VAASAAAEGEALVAVAVVSVAARLPVDSQEAGDQDRPQGPPAVGWAAAPGSTAGHRSALPEERGLVEALQEAGPGEELPAQGREGADQREHVLVCNPARGLRSQVAAQGSVAPAGVGSVQGASAAEALDRELAPVPVDLELEQGDPVRGLVLEVVALGSVSSRPAEAVPGLVEGLEQVSVPGLERGSEPESGPESGPDNVPPHCRVWGVVVARTGAARISPRRARTAPPTCRIG
jgi:hypothetical protein